MGPKIGVETAVLGLNLLEHLGVFPSAEHLLSMPDDVRVLQRVFQVGIRHVCNALNVEMMELRAIAVAFFKHCFPAEPRVRAFQNQHLKQQLIVVHRHPPFRIVVMGIEFGMAAKASAVIINLHVDCFNLSQFCAFIKQPERH